MKKTTVLILLFCYLVPTIGLSCKLHYCGGKLASFSVVFIQKLTCACGNKAMKKDCCKDKTITHKIQDSQAHSKRIILSLHNTIKFLMHTYEITNLNLTQSEVKKHIHFLHPPPLQKNEPPYLLNRVFLI